jgi:hypothetical protein
VTFGCSLTTLPPSAAFYQGGSFSKLLHELILRLTKAEMKYGFSLHNVHVAGTRMIAQGTDGLSRGIMLEGIVQGKDTLSFVDLSKTATEQHRGVLDYVKTWLDSSVGSSKLLNPEGWFGGSYWWREGSMWNVDT